MYPVHNSVYNQYVEGVGKAMSLDALPPNCTYWLDLLHKACIQNWVQKRKSGCTFPFTFPKRITYCRGDKCYYYFPMSINIFTPTGYIRFCPPTSEKRLKVAKLFCLTPSKTAFYDGFCNLNPEPPVCMPSQTVP